MTEILKLPADNQLIITMGHTSFCDILFSCLQFLHFAPQVCSLFLDTHLYNAHTVAAEILHGGLPILTLPGETMASRVATSFISSLHLQDELTASNYSDYVDKAVYLYDHPDKLGRIRARILEQVEGGESLLFNLMRFARNFVSGLQEVWRRYRNRQKLAHNIYVTSESSERNEDSHTEL